MGLVELDRLSNSWIKWSKTIETYVQQLLHYSDPHCVAHIPCLFQDSFASEPWRGVSEQESRLRHQAWALSVQASTEAEIEG